jgi:predicted dehydrogenase
VEDSSTTLLRFKSGAQGVVDAFFNVPDAAGQSRLEIYGNKGSIQAKHTIGQTAGGEMEAYISEASKQYDPQQEKAALEVARRKITCEPYNMYRGEVEYLSSCIEENKEPEMNTAASGIYIMRIIEAAYESARSGKAVAI